MVIEGMLTPRVACTEKAIIISHRPHTIAPLPPMVYKIGFDGAPPNHCACNASTRTQKLEGSLNESVPNVKLRLCVDMCPIANHQSPSECHNSHLHGHRAPARSLHCLPWCTKLGALAARRRENSHWHGHTAPTRSPHCLPWCTKLGFMPPLQIIALATRRRELRCWRGRWPSPSRT